jgi:hypothetical protein
MKLKDILGIVCPPGEPVARARATPTQMYSDGCVMSENTYNLLQISFEHACTATASPTQRTPTPRAVKPPPHGSHMPPKTKAPSPPLNPIYRIIHRTGVEKTAKTAKTADAAIPPKIRNTSSPKSDTPLLTQGVWNTSAIAPLIRWLDEKRVRFVHSDWVTHRTNGERVQIVSQRGVVLENRQCTKTTSYTCHGGFRNIHLRVSRCSVNDATTGETGETGETELFALPTNGAPYQHGVYTTQYQQRAYAWAENTRIYLSTTDSKQYRVTVEHNMGNAAANENENDNDNENVLSLIASLSYHLSHHVRRHDSQHRQKKSSRHSSV